MSVLEQVRTVISENRGTILLLVGLFLLLNPQLTAGLAETDSDQYHYESFQVTLNDDGTIDWPDRVEQIDSDVPCLSLLKSRPCILERAAFAKGGIVYDGPDGMFLHDTYSYVYILPGEGFVEPVERDLGGGAVRYGHDPVEASTAMDQISTPIDRASAEAQEAIEQGSVDTSDELQDANELIEADGEYYVVNTRNYQTGADDGTWVTVLVRWLPGLLGFGLVIVGHYLQAATAVKRVR